MPGIGDLFGKGSTAEQFLVWGVLQQLLQPLLAPVSTELLKLVQEKFPEIPLSAEQAAGLVARGFETVAAGAATAAQNGVNAGEFAQLVHAAGTAPALGTVIAAYQRGLIDAGAGDPASTTLTGALADGAVRADWWPIVEKLAVQIPSVAEVMNAWLEGQIGEAEARTRYLAAGGDPTWFHTSYNANGTAPTPMEALEMLNRGLIPETGTGPDAVSYQQAFLEGPWRNKWEPVMLGLREYYPPPRTVTAMFHAGQLDHTQAAMYLAKQGLTPDLIAAYLSEVTKTTTTTEKHLAKTDIVTLYNDKLLSRADATKSLIALNYSAHDADLILQLADVRTTTAQLNAGVSRVRTLFESGKFTEAEAKAALSQLKIDPAQATEMVTTWAITETGTIRQPSTAQIVDAWYYEMMSPADCIARLQSYGYDAADAYLVMAVKNKGPVPGLPLPPGLHTPPPPPPLPGATPPPAGTPGGAVAASGGGS